MTPREPMDQAQLDALDREYQLGYTAGHIAGVGELHRAQHADRLRRARGTRRSVWGLVWYWSSLAAVALCSTMLWLGNDYTRFDSFCDGVAVMTLLMVATRERRPR